jgi:hypothetical protein
VFILQYFLHVFDVLAGRGDMELADADESGGQGSGGIDRDDPMLAWATLHQPAAVRENGNGNQR